MTWQPIETAPKDTDVLAVEECSYTSGREKRTLRYCVVALYDSDMREWVTASSETVNPTHWMPLPPLPGEE